MTDRLRRAAEARKALIGTAKRASEEIATEREAVLEARRRRLEASADRDRTDAGGDGQTP